MKVGIINVTGYAGAEIARILCRHPEAKISSVTGRSEAGKQLGEVFPHLCSIDLPITEDITGSVDVVFSALPHSVSAEKLAPLVTNGIKAIDISADFRLKSVSEYQDWYKVTHPCPELISKAVYGLTELNRKEVASATLVANPGCYPTATILALAPALKAGIIEPDIIVDAKSGVSGAGRGLSLKTHFSEVNESVSAYSVEGHRHMPEIAQELKRVGKLKSLKLTFLTHLMPMTRGILSSCYATFKDGAIAPGEQGKIELRELYAEFYKGEQFVKVTDTPPATKQTLGSNNCLVFPSIDVRSNRLMVISCIDNLVKGAAGQAIQNMNLMFGIPEATALNQLAIYP